ncbi:MAG: spore cortex biosynthesis protein YabQ [Firmicutes bacterium]|nr:spore cortex biosynthesis protein YabQ [Bacillota bacterium]
MTLHTQWVTMALMLGSGCLMGMMLDLYRILTRRFRLGGWAVSLIDLLYWVVAAGLVFSLLMWSNWGEFRFYILVAILAGWITYYTWFSPGVSRGMEWGVEAVFQTFRFCLRVLRLLIWVPLMWLGVLLTRIVQLIYKGLKRILRLPLSLFAPLGRRLKSWGNRLLRPVDPVLRPLIRGVDKIRRWWRGRDREDP